MSFTLCPFLWLNGVPGRNEEKLEVRLEVCDWLAFILLLIE
ncbi:MULTISPECIES: hypothetical protein [unclassified Oceanobacillus]|nr:hypothetical protein [Oceanobacillus sp. AG]